MTQEKRVFTVASHGGEYLFYVIEAVVLLNHERPSDTRVTFLPFEPPFATWLKRMRARLRGTRKNPEVVRKPAGVANDTIYTQLQQGKGARIERAGYVITLQRQPLSSLTALSLWLGAAARAARLWLACYHERRFQPLTFLRTRYRGVQIGELAAATFFRTNLSADEPQPVPALFFMLWWSCYLIDVAAALVDARDAANGYTITPEPSYLHSAPYRYLRRLGFKGLDIYQPNTPLLTLEGAEDVSVPRRLQLAAGTGTNSLPANIEEQVAEYFRERLAVAPKLLWYMAHGHNDNHASEVIDIDGRRVSLDPTDLYATIFLHSFEDGQYYFGVDGFASLGDWTYRTIEACLANHEFSGVIIKPHPNANYDAHPGDRRALERLVRRYRSHPRIVILSPNASIVHLCAAARIVGLTHHGSVAEELVYLGQPVLASTFAWWSDQYRFARLWSTPQEYAALIAQQSRASWRPPAADERRELYRYLIDFRFREVPCDRTFPSFILARLRNHANGESPVRLRFEETTMYSRELEKLRADDPVVLQLLHEFERLAVDPPVLWPLNRAS